MQKSSICQWTKKHIAVRYSVFGRYNIINTSIKIKLIVFRTVQQEELRFIVKPLIIGHLYKKIGSKN